MVSRAEQCCCKKWMVCSLLPVWSRSTMHLGTHTVSELPVWWLDLHEAEAWYMISWDRDPDNWSASRFLAEDFSGRMNSQLMERRPKCVWIQKKTPCFKFRWRLIEPSGHTYRQVFDGWLIGDCSELFSKLPTGRWCEVSAKRPEARGLESAPFGWANPTWFFVPLEMWSSVGITSRKRRYRTVYVWDRLRIQMYEIWYLGEARTVKCKKHYQISTVLYGHESSNKKLLREVVVIETCWCRKIWGQAVEVPNHPHFIRIRSRWSCMYGLNSCFCVAWFCCMTSWLVAAIYLKAG